MTVEVNTAGSFGQRPAVVFTDSLTGADQPLATGTQWITAFNLRTNNSGGVEVAAALNRTASGLRFGNSTGAGYIPSAIAIPLNIYYPYISVRNQFAQATWVSSTGIADYDLCVVGVQNTFTFYGLNQGTGGINQWILYRRTQAGDTTLIAASVATAYANGDVMRIEADITSSASQTVLTIYKNGVVVGTFTDATGSRFSTGIPFLFFNGSNPTPANLIIKDYSGGVLLT